jgi:hypothetical protein
VHRPLTLILPGKMCVHELIHGCCIDLYTHTHTPHTLPNFRKKLLLKIFAKIRD